MIQLSLSAEYCEEYCQEYVIRKYSDMVYRLAFSNVRNTNDADDIYQEVFLRYIRKKPVFQTEEHEKAWLIRVTINCCKKMWVSAWKQKIVPLDSHLEKMLTFELDEETFLHNELQKLPVKYRTIIHLFYYEDMSVEEISDVLQQKSSAIRMQLTRARRKLEKILKEDI